MKKTSKFPAKLKPAELSGAKLVSWSKAMPGSPVKLSKESKAGVLVDQQGSPHLFIFDTFAFLDILSEIDDSLSSKLSHKEYHSKSANPAGWMIDEIEARVPTDPSFIRSLKNAIEEAEDKGWIPFSEVQSELKL